MTRLRKLLFFITLAPVFFLTFSIYAKTIYVLSFNDFHSKIYHNKAKNFPGMLFFINAILSEIQKCGKDNVILVSGGDNYQGSIVSYDTKGAPVSDMFKELKVAFSTVGNHEFDWGQKYFDMWEKNGNFSYLVANIFDKKTRESPSWSDPYKIIKVQGIKVAFISLTTIETKLKGDPKGLEGLDVSEPCEIAQKWINYLKAGNDKDGVPDVIVALTHIPSIQDKTTGKIIGEEINNLCSNTTGLDVVISGHSHETVCGKINGVLVIQSECYGRKYGIIKIDINDRTKKINRIEAEVCAVPTTSVKIFPENVGEEILKKYSSIEKKYSEIIGVSTLTLPYDKFKVNALGVYIAELMAESTGSQIAFLNGLGNHGDLNEGNIFVEDAYAMCPNNNRLVKIKLSGKSIKNVTEYGLTNKIGSVQFYGMTVKIDSSKPIGDRVVSMTLLNTGKNVEMEEDYSVCITDFMLSGGNAYKFDKAKRVKKYELGIRDVFIDGIKRTKILTLPQPNCLIDIAKEKKLNNKPVHLPPLSR